MGECGVTPTPDHFELFYVYASGDNAAVTQTMGQLIAARRTITADMLADIRQRYLSSARAARTMDNLGSSIGDVITTVLDKLEAAGREAVDYSATLSAATGGLSANQSPADMRKLVDGLIVATREMENRAKNLEGELQRSSEQVTELRSKLDNVRKESLTDPLTGIANRKAFDNQVDALKSRAPGEAVSLLLCDIDHFKRFNDTWGHQTGDQVLRLVANCLSENVKGRDLAARYGGEEFAVLLRGDLESAAKVAEDIRLAVEGRKLVKKSTGEVLGTITISIGDAQFADGEAAEAVIRRADACLYGAKHHGRNLVITQNDPRMPALEISAA